MFSRGLLAPKILKTTFKAKKAPKTITSPTTAAIRCFLALSTPTLSPLEVMYLIPPYIKYAKAKNVAIAKSQLIINCGTLEIFISGLIDPGGGDKVSEAAKAEVE